MIYLYITPSGSVNLIEGDKMPVKPVYSDHVKHSKYYWQINKFERLNRAYTNALESAKASSVPVDDQERAKAIIYTSKQPEVAHLSLKPDTIYGPFDIGHEIKSFSCNSRLESNELPCPLSDEFMPDCCCSKNKTAILAPSNLGNVKALYNKKNEFVGYEIGKLTPEQVKEREEAINWYRGERTIENKKEWSALEIAIYACNAGNSEESINEVAGMIERFKTAFSG